MGFIFKILSIEGKKSRVGDLREQHSMLLHFTSLFNTEIGCVGKACKKEQVTHLCCMQCIVWSVAFSLGTCSQITHKSYSISKGLCTECVLSF